MSEPAPLVDVLLLQTRHWKSGERPRVEDLLARHSHLAGDDNAVLDLIYNEMMLREEAGDRPALDEYLGRFPRLEAELRVQFEVEQAMTLDEVAGPAPTGKTTTPFAGPAGRESGQAPDWLEGCDLLEEVGRGAMGAVWRAWQRGARRLVAVKLLAADVPAGRIRTEIEAATRLSHPNIVQVFEVREHAGRTALVLEYVEGGNLAQRLAGRPQSPRDAARLVEVLAWAIAHAHGRAVVHRDLKPSNVLLGGDDDAPLAQGVPKISDFGLAKLTEGGLDLTRTTDVLGTPSYMAPEQTGGQGSVGPLADVYALGAILYECLTGRPPFLGESVLDTLEQVRNQEPVPPSRLQPRIPRDLEIICLKCLHKAPARRYASARELGEDLRRFLDESPIRARPVGWGERVWKWARRRPAAAALIAVSLLAVGLLLAGGLSVNRILRGERDRALRQAGELDARLEQTRRLLYTTQLLRGGAMWPTDPQQGLRLLEDPGACPPYLHCFSWGVLYNQCKRYRQALPCAAPVTALAVRRDAQVIAAGGADGRIHLHDPAGGVVAILAGHTTPVTVLAFSPDATVLASGDGEGLIQLWQQPGGRALARVQVTGRVAGLAFHPDGRKLVSASGHPRGLGSARLWVWDAQKKTLRSGRTFRGSTHPLSGVALSPDGHLLACADRDHGIRLWDTRTGKAGGVLRGHTAAVTALAFAGEGRLLLSGSADGNLRLWDPTREREVDNLDVAVGAIQALAVHPGGQSVAVGGIPLQMEAGGEGGADLQVWDVLARRGEEPIRAHGGTHALVYLPDGRTLLSGGADRTLKWWDHPGRRERLALREHTGAAGSVGLSRDGRTLAWIRRHPPGGAGTVIDVYDLRRGMARPVLRGHGRPIRCLAVSADGQQVASTAGNDDEPAELLVWDTATGGLKLALSGHGMAVGALAASADGQGLASAALDGVVKVWDLSTGRQRLHLQHGKTPWRSVAFSGDGKSVAAGGGNGPTGVVAVWDAVSGELRRRLQTREPVGCVALTPDGERLAWSGTGGVVRLVDVAGEVDLALDTGMKGVAWLAISPDGRTLAVAGTGTGVKLWDVPGAQERASLPGHRSGACYAAFTERGDLLLSVGRAEGARLWYSSVGRGGKRG